MTEQRNNKPRFNRPRKNFNQGPITWDYTYLHKYNDAIKNAAYWQGNGQYMWSKEWLQYAGDMLTLAKGQSVLKIKPRYPQCLGNSQIGSPYVKPGHLQGIHI